MNIHISVLRLTWQLEAGVSWGGAGHGRRLPTVSHVRLWRMSLSMHHCQPKPQPLSVRLSSETNRHTNTQESKELTETTHKQICRQKRAERSLQGSLNTTMKMSHGNKQDKAKQGLCPLWQEERWCRGVKQNETTEPYKHLQILVITSWQPMGSSQQW